MQHDDHCWVVCGGRLWRIVGKAGHALYVVNEGYAATLDLSAFRFEEYANAAAARLGASPAATDPFPPVRE